MTDGGLGRGGTERGEGGWGAESSKTVSRDLWMVPYHMVFGNDSASEYGELPNSAVLQGVLHEARELGGKRAAGLCICRLHRQLEMVRLCIHDWIVSLLFLVEAFPKQASQGSQYEVCMSCWPKGLIRGYRIELGHADSA